MHCRQQAAVTDLDSTSIKETFHLGDNGFAILHQLEEEAKNQNVGADAELSTTDTGLKMLWKASQKGCDECNHTGYKGRIGIYEALNNSLAIQKLIISNATSNQIQSQAIAEGMVTMQTDGLIKALRGETTIEEVLRVTKN
jgi:type II secretory ATPase GspE/PulE/Tfp pilus assembly ATPase PilB-like protein